MNFAAVMTLRFGIERGFSQSDYILCPVCWNAAIVLTHWEDGSEEAGECIVCRRIEESMDDAISEP